MNVEMGKFYGENKQGNETQHCSNDNRLFKIG
jgi:hypothetical protein